MARRKVKVERREASGPAHDCLGLKAPIHGRIGAYLACDPRLVLLLPDDERAARARREHGGP